MLLFPDKHNFHDRNVKTLLGAIKDSKKKLYVDEHRDDLKKAHGNYREFSQELRKSMGYFSRLNTTELKTYKYRNIPLFDAVKYELFGQVYQQTAVIEKAINCDENGYWEIVFENSKTLLFALYAVAQYWIKHWSTVLKKHPFEKAFIFSNTLTYTRALSYLLEEQGIETFVIEHFFTGNDFYLEKRYSAIPNDSLLNSQAYRSNFDNSEKAYSQALKKIAERKNKNVTQPEYQNVDFFQNEQPVCLLLCQVVNDAAIMSPNNRFRNTIAFYKQLIQQLLERTNHCIIVKTHPYEPQKNKQKKKLTFNYLEQAYTKEHRIKIVDEYNIEALIDKADYAMTLNSQAGLEALIRNKPVFTFGGAFYSGANFTEDHDNISDAITQLEKHGLPEFCDTKAKNLRSFLATSFDSLISNSKNEQLKINRVLNL